jgi:hypothetical protein
VRKKLTELRTDFLRQFEPTMPAENPGTDAFVALIQLEIDWVMARLRSDPLIGNLLVVTDKGASDESKLQAIQEIKKLIKAGIAKGRGHLVKPELRRIVERARDSDRKDREPVLAVRTVREIAELNILSAIQLAIEAVDEFTVEDKAN